MFSRVTLKDLRKGICQYELKARPGLTQIGRDEIWAYLPQPQAKKSPIGASIEGSFSPSQ
jgi:hypothetical protein